MRVRVLGTDREKIRNLREQVEQALKRMGANAEIVDVDKIDEITMLGVLDTPAVMVDERLVCEGRIPSVEDLIGWITGSLQASGQFAMH